MKIIFEFHGFLDTSTGLYIRLEFMSPEGQVYGMAPFQYIKFTKKL